MRYATWSFLLATLLLALVVYVGSAPLDPNGSGGVQAAEPTTGPQTAKASKKKKDEAAKKDDAAKKGDAAKKKDDAAKKDDAPAAVADNSACFVCHANYDGESLAGEHAKVNLGCMKCHGESVAHRNDEDNITPPDTMYATDQIDKACVQCHETHDAPAKKVLATWQKRCPAKENPDDLVCTDCHGEHRLRFRTVWWDKKTGKLARAKGERIKYNPDYTKKPGQPKPSPK